MTDLPAWLSSLLREQGKKGPADSEPARAGRADVVPGDFWVAENLNPGIADPSVVLVLEVDKRLGLASVALATEHYELDSDKTLHLPRNTTGMPFPISVHGDIRGHVWIVQLRRRLGELNRDDKSRIVKAMVEFAWDQLPREWFGLPFETAGGPRWQFKKDELKRLDTVTSDCHNDLLLADEQITERPHVERSAYDIALVRGRPMDAGTSLLRLSRAVGSFDGIVCNLDLWRATTNRILRSESWREYPGGMETVTHIGWIEAKIQAGLSTLPAMPEPVLDWQFEDGSADRWTTQDLGADRRSCVPWLVEITPGESIAEPPRKYQFLRLLGKDGEGAIKQTKQVIAMPSRMVLAR